MHLSDEVVDAVREARHVVAFTGAGTSAESGVPTFRDAQTGLWEQYDPAELATPEAFEANPGLVWRWYAWRRELCAGAKPNPGHLALVELAGRVPRLDLITQNVDGLHQRAGSPEVIELHGNLTRVVCSRTRRGATTWDDHEVPPRHPETGHSLRPDVVWFGEALPEEALARAFDAARRCDVFLSVGTSTVVYPAAGLPFEALRAGAAVVEINPTPTPLTPLATHAVRGLAGVVLPELVARIPR